MRTNKIFQFFFENPTSITDCQNTPEVVYSCWNEDISHHSQQVKIQILGYEASTVEFINDYSKTPDMYVHELNDIHRYYDLFCSTNERIIIDSFRTYTEDKKIHRTYRHAQDDTIVQKSERVFYVKRLPFTKVNHRISTEPVCLINSFEPSGDAYGHWLLETLPALWPMDKERQRFLLPCYIRNIPNYFLQFCLPFKIQQSDFLFSSELEIIHHSFIKSKPYMHFQYITDHAKKAWSAVAQFYTSKNASRSSSKKLYISRENISTRPLINEKACKDLFLKYGFTSISPEKMSINEQINLFAHAEYVAGPVGSGLHNIVFSLNPDRVKLLALCPPNGFKPLGSYANIEGQYKRTLAICMGMIQQGSSWMMSLNELETAIRQWLDIK